MPKKLTSITGLIVVAVIVLAANLIVALLLDRAKIDMTEEKLYTLSAGSTNILQALEDKITAKLYYSKSVAAENPRLLAYQAYADRVVEMLREYQAMSKGKLFLEIIDPKPDTEEEEWAEKYGLQGVPVGPGARVFLGLVLKDESDNERVIPFLSPEREDSLEYDLSKLVYALNYATTHPNKEKPAVGLISGINLGVAELNPMMQRQQNDEWMFLRELRASFSIQNIDTQATELPKDLDLLLIVHPKNMSEMLEYAIDQYVLAGGNALVFVDPLSFKDQAGAENMDMQMRMMTSFSSNLPRLFKAWGVELETGGAMPGMMGMQGGGEKMKIVIDPNMATTVPTERGYQQHPALLTLAKKNVNHQEIVTSQLDNMVMAFAGALKKTSNSDDVRFETLLSATESASTVDDMMFRFGMPSPEQLLKDAKPGGAPLTLACKISGKFKTAFEKGKPVEAKDEEGKNKGAVTYEADEKQLKESKEQATIVVVADVDMLANDLSVRANNLFGYSVFNYINDNIPFLSNAVENLTGSKDLIALRSRGRSQRPFTVVDEIERKAQERWLEQQKNLEAKISEATQRLNELKRGSGNDSRILDTAYANEVRKLREDRARMQGELRDIRRHLREDVEHLGRTVKFINIALIPLLVVMIGVAIVIIKRMRRKKTA